MAACSDSLVLHGIESSVVMHTWSNEILKLHTTIYIPVRDDSCLKTDFRFYIPKLAEAKGYPLPCQEEVQVMYLDAQHWLWF